MKTKATFIIIYMAHVLVLDFAGIPAYAVDFNTDVLDATDRQNL